MQTPQLTRIQRQLYLPRAVVAGLILLLAGARDGRCENAAEPTPRLAAPGYAADATCAPCHREIYTAYQAVGMARSFFRPRRETELEDFESEPFFHEPSQRWYEMRREGEGLTFRRYQKDAAGKPTLTFEVKVDWVLGSGHHARTYLYRNPAGELYQLPLAWYSQEGRWAMAPGYDNPQHEGISRLVRRECMFCHNAYPQAAAGSDVYGESHVFPQDLPEGTGCQRCHGPGAEHVRLANDLKTPLERIRSSVVNPAKLSPELRDDVCNQCHLQPSVALMPVRRFDRDDYSYRPGEPLTDYIVHLDVEEAHQAPGDRFEINHHPYRLRQSRCWLESGPEKLSCLTCHDPHRKVPPEERAAHYRAACFGCHAADDCRLDEMKTERAAELPAVDPQDCVTCHMPKRRTQDVVHAVMADHLIRRRPGGAELLAPREEHIPILVDAKVLDPARGPEGAEAEIYRTAAVVRAGGDRSAVGHLAKLLEIPRDVTAPPWPLPPYIDLLKGLLRSGQFAQASGWVGRLPERALLREWDGIALASQGHLEDAISRLRSALALDAERPESRFNLGLLLLASQRPAEALKELDRTLALRPTLAAAWFHKGNALAALERPAEAEEAYRQALVNDPGSAKPYLALARLLASQDRTDEARGVLELGARTSRQKEVLEKEVERIADR